MLLLDVTHDLGRYPHHHLSGRYVLSIRHNASLPHNAPLPDLNIEAYDRTHPDNGIVGDGVPVEHRPVANSHVFPNSTDPIGSDVHNGQRIPAGKMVMGVPAEIVGNVQQKHKDFWVYGKQLYVDLAKRYPQELEQIG